MMTRYFVICTDPITKGQSDSLREWIKQEDLSWWHWIDGTWLISSEKEDIDSDILVEKVQEFAKGTTCLVMEINPATWVGYGPNSEDRNMFTWLEELWP